MNRTWWSPSQFFIFLIFQFLWVYTFFYWYAFRNYINRLLLWWILLICSTKLIWFIIFEFLIGSLYLWLVLLIYFVVFLDSLFWKVSILIVVHIFTFFFNITKTKLFTLLNLTDFYIVFLKNQSIWNIIYLIYKTKKRVFEHNKVKQASWVIDWRLITIK